MQEQAFPSSRKLSWGRSPFIACQADLRFSYCLYIPSSHCGDRIEDLSLIVVVHGSMRTAERYRDAFVDFAEQQQCVVLAPLFPVGILTPEDTDSFKLHQPSELRYDKVLLQMVDEVRERFRLTSERFLLHGFSGGGQFAHRFFYLHPERVQALSVGAPGEITPINESLQWWQKTHELPDLEKCLPAIEQMRCVPVQLIVGSKDRTEDVERGNYRLKNLTLLADSYAENGIHVSLEVVDGVDHNGFLLIPAVQKFFIQCLKSVDDICPAP